MESILTGSIFSGEHFVLGSIFWRAFFGEHLAGSIFSGSIWVYTLMNGTKKLVFCLVMSMLPYIAVSNYRLGLFVENSSSVVL